MAISEQKCRPSYKCLTCWSEGEIDETIWARNYDPIIPDELQSTQKDD